MQLLRAIAACTHVWTAGSRAVDVVLLRTWLSVMLSATFVGRFSVRLNSGQR